MSSAGRFVGIREIVISDQLAPNNLLSEIVPPGHGWKLMLLTATLLSSSASGNRRLAIRIRNANDYVVHFFDGGLDQAASDMHTYFFAPGNPNETAVIDGGDIKHIRRALCSDLWLPESYQVGVLDKANIDDADDEISLCRMIVEDYTE